MAKEGPTFRTYTEEFNLKAVRAYVSGSSSYKVVAKREGIRNCSQLKVWVKKWQNEESFDERKDSESNQFPILISNRELLRTCEAYAEEA